MSSAATRFNALVAETARQRPLRSLTRQGRGGTEHQWTVTAARQGTKQDFGLNPLTGQAYFSASVFGTHPPDVDRIWRVEVGAGSVNGTPAEISGLPLWEDPAPGLIATTPSEDGKAPGDFQVVPPSQRPKAFRTVDAWEKELWRTSVYVSGTRPFAADPLLDLAVLDLALLPDAPTLVGLIAGEAIRETLASIGLLERINIAALRPPFKAHVGSLPLILDGTENLRLAWLYLLRAPGASPRVDVLFVKQLCFWNLAAFSLLEDEGLLALSELLSVTGDVGVLTGLEIVQMLLDSTRVRWWTR